MRLIIFIVLNQDKLSFKIYLKKHFISLIKYETIQMLKNVKQIIDVSKARGCWKDEELKDIGITYHNVCEIYKLL